MATAVAARTPEVVWGPHPGSQPLVLSCPHFECLFEGTRGPGKTDTLLMDYAQHVGQGYGRSWRGVIFRREYKALGEIVAKSQRWFRRIFPSAQWLASKSDYLWRWPDGEELLFRAFDRPSDYWDHHGHELPFIGWDELTTWPDLAGYHVMKSCCRSATEGIPKKYRATTNPYGPGHNAVKAYFIDPAPAGVAFEPPTIELPEEFQDLKFEGERLLAVRIHGHYSENTHLMRAQPNYPQVIAAAAQNPEQARAWLAGDWDIVAGGMFDDVWRRSVHVLPGWPPALTPSSWRIDRSYDWGSTRPFSLGWWAESDGTPAPDGRVYARKTLFRIAEWYGWNGQPNEGLRMTDPEIARGILKREKEMGIEDRIFVGPADSSIFVASPNYESTADIMARIGVRFIEADKKPGSRKAGWSEMRTRMKASLQGAREEPGLYTFESCGQFIRTVPVLTRDERDPDDCDTEAEDHCADEARYRCTAPKLEARTRTWRV